MKWIALGACPLCGAKEALPYGHGHAPAFSVEGILGGAKLTVDTSYFQCLSCGVIFQNPRLDDASIAELYYSGEYRNLLNDTQENVDADERARAMRITPLVSEGRHLDVGCSRGYLLDMTREKGCTVFGVEPNAEYVTTPVESVRSLDEVKFPGTWDTVTCLHVLEHVPAPLEFAERLVKLTKPGGRLVVEVPGDRSQGGPLRLFHLYHYQPWVLRRMFSELEVEHFELNPHALFVFKK